MLNVTSKVQPGRRSNFCFWKSSAEVSMRRTINQFNESSEVSNRTTAIQTTIYRELPQGCPPLQPHKTGKSDIKNVAQTKSISNFTLNQNDFYNISIPQNKGEEWEYFQTKQAQRHIHTHCTHTLYTAWHKQSCTKACMRTLTALLIINTFLPGNS